MSKAIPERATPEWVTKAVEACTKKRPDGRLDLLRMPLGFEVKDALPGPLDHNGVRKRWVGFGWVEEGPAAGTEPLVLHMEGS